MGDIRQDQPVADDAEGHMRRGPLQDDAELATDATDDTEGHKQHRFDGADDADGADDTEGHKQHRFDGADDADGADDTEGHKQHR